MTSNFRLFDSAPLRHLVLAACAAFLLGACGGGTANTATKASVSSMPTPDESLQRQAQGATLNTQELEEALAQAKSIAPDSSLNADQPASLAAFKAGQVAQKASATLLPVYRFYNSSTGAHFFTASTSERDSVIAGVPAFSFEGQAFLAASKASAGLKPVYRFFNTQTGVHFYTISESERAAIEVGLPQFTPEGVAYYASQVTGTGFTPLYRFFKPFAGTHFYTASETERQQVQDTLSSSYSFEGVGYYVFDSSYSLAAPMVFAAFDGTHAAELWTTDGTTAGTVMIKDIYPGFAHSSPTEFTRLNGMQIFSANDGSNGIELWKTDGTAEGTVMIKDIYPGAAGSHPSQFTRLNGALYFRANDGIHGEELWKTDGTETGTVMVNDIRPGGEGSHPAEITVFDGGLYFQAADGFHDGQGMELWTSDGTSAGTRIVKDINPVTGSYPVGLAPFNGTLYFHATDSSNGYELWKTDGTAAGTVMVKDIAPGWGEGSYLSDHIWFDGAMYFVADDGNKGRELWKTDGTPAGTLLVKDINLGAPGSNPTEFTVSEFAKLVIELTNSNSTVVYEPLPQDDPKQRRPDITKAKEVLNWEPTVDLDEGLSRTIDYFTHHLKNIM